MFDKIRNLFSGPPKQPTRQENLLAATQAARTADNQRQKEAGQRAYNFLGGEEGGLTAERGAQKAFREQPGRTAAAVRSTFEAERRRRMTGKLVESGDAKDLRPRRPKTP